jgi:very-short-patch-repair endonuclease
VKISREWEQTSELIKKVFQISWYGGLVNTAYNEHEELMFFDRDEHEKIINNFKNIDKSLLFYAQEALVKKHHDDLPSIYGAGEIAILLHEMNKKRRHKPIRTLIREAGHAIQSIKPVFMMSPMSIPTYLEQGSIEFDLVIFDEASQVKVVDAIGAILRGKQVVVVGDTKQMPPTDFFNKSLEIDDEEAAISETADIESILGMFLSKGSPQTMLKWHYRSRHDSLIAVSNYEFYDNKLMIFPSPGVNPYATGLKFWHTENSIYERGSSRSNPIEAQIIAKAVIDHAKNTPSLTLGVVAFSTAQRDRIILELEILRRNDPSAESFFGTSNLEGFFIKNLENVQGDERDVIFISIGYGRTNNGTVSKSFGPLNREGGERRLNVLISRSKLAMVVFSNFKAEDLDTSNETPFGVRALKRFLYYAQKGEFENAHETGRETDSPFEDAVIQAINNLGYSVEPQVGSAGFYIDIAVKDPNKPGRYILAVECDGATYHSSRTARDRDRLRQSVLEDLGWRFHRIWSTDWFRNRENEIMRLDTAIKAAQDYYDSESVSNIDPDESKKKTIL